MKEFNFSYDMYILDMDGGFKSTNHAVLPLGVGYITSENKNITPDDIYRNIQKSRKHEYFNDIVDHPYDPYLSLTMPRQKVLKIDQTRYLVVNNIRKL